MGSDFVGVDIVFDDIKDWVIMKPIFFAKNLAFVAFNLTWLIYLMI